VRPSASDFGVTAGLNFLPDGIPITGVAGDQQAALFGQGGVSAGSAKCTYGTGAFFLLHTGSKAARSQKRLLTSVAAFLDNQPQYVLEGSVFVAGSAVQWLRDGLRVIESAPAVEGLAAHSKADEDLILVPALVGLGAPYWVPEARGVLFGITRGTTSAELAQAALEGVAFQVSDLIDAASGDLGAKLTELRVDGGMAGNNWFLQFQADVLGVPVQRALHAESTALGAAFLAGLRAGVWPNVDSFRRLASVAATFDPHWDEHERVRRRAGWQRAVRAVIEFYRPAHGT
jgi:glycerol kinase